ncbi:hypothetical protein V2J09_010475 [Rumex salicifolius]
MANSGSTYWCYRCERFVASRSRHIVICPDCGSGFVEELDDSDSTLVPLSPRHLLRPYHSPLSISTGAVGVSPNLSHTSYQGAAARRTRRRGAHDQPSSFNPVIVLRSPGENDNGGDNGSGSGDGESRTERRNYQLYYDDGAGVGLRPLPVSISEFLMGSGFDRLLDQLSHLEINDMSRLENPPAAKSAVESMPVVKIVASQVDVECQCAVCKEDFELDGEAREMPCKHIYHANCILPWLSLRNSCPVCRYELPTEAEGGVTSPPGSDAMDESAGMTIWRLPGGGFAVGRFSGGQRVAGRELSAVYTEMDGRFNENSNHGGAPRRITWASSATRTRERRGASTGHHFCKSGISHHGVITVTLAQKRSTINSACSLRVESWAVTTNTGSSCDWARP